MPRLFACIISADMKRDKALLISVAREFAYHIETLDDGVLFDVSGLEGLIGKPESIAAKILDKLGEHTITGSIGVADTVDSACLLAREHKGQISIGSSDVLSQLSLSALPIEQDTLGVFSDLGILKVEDLLNIPEDDLINRYGKDLQKIIDVIEQKGSSQLTPNVKKDRISWACELDSPVEDFEQLIFLLNRGFERSFAEIAHYGLSTEHLDIDLKLRNKTARSYEIKASFPTLERAFWLKLTNLRIALDPPGTEITSVRVTVHFTKPRPSQRGLYAVSRPEPESLLLTVNKLKKLVGEENVGLPVILDQRIAEPFILEPDLLPKGVEAPRTEPRRPSLAFTYYRPPLRAEVSYRDGRLIFVRTRYFEGRVAEYSGVWKGNSTWWDRPWKTKEWDIEIENRGIYRLCKANKEWFLSGEYD